MELCAYRCYSNLLLHHRRLLNPELSHLHSSASFRLQRSTVISPRYPGLHYLAHPFLRSTTSEETSTSTNEQFEGPDAVSSMEESPVDEQNTLYVATTPAGAPKESFSGLMQAFEFLDGVNLKELLQLDLQSAYPILINGSGSLVVLWLASAIVGAIDSIPLFPNLLELVGFVFTIWFTSQYLIFKKDRDELLAKLEELKQQIIGY